MPVLSCTHWAAGVMERMNASGELASTWTLGISPVITGLEVIGAVWGPAAVGVAAGRPGSPGGCCGPPGGVSAAMGAGGLSKFWICFCAQVSPAWAMSVGLWTG